MLLHNFCNFIIQKVSILDRPSNLQEQLNNMNILYQPPPTLTNSENSMAVLPSSICKLRKRGMFNRTSRRNSAGMAASAAAAADDEETRYHSEVEDNDDDDDDDTESPPEPLPLYQQRENYFT